MSHPTKKMSLFQATMLVSGNMVGTGIFLLPVSLAAIGGIAVFGWLIAAAGAAALGLAFAKLGELDPQEGGPYAYARDFLGQYIGFQKTTSIGLLTGLETSQSLWQLWVIWQNSYQESTVPAPAYLPLLWSSGRSRSPISEGHASSAPSKHGP